eukprot:g3974.t1
MGRAQLPPLVNRTPHQGLSGAPAVQLRTMSSSSPAWSPPEQIIPGGGPFPMHGTISYDASTATATWTGSWASSMEDLTSGDEKKSSAFHFEGKHSAGAAGVSAGAAVGAAGSNASTASSAPGKEGAAESDTGALGALAALAAGVSQAEPTTSATAPASSSVFDNFSWSGHIKYRTLDKLHTIKEVITDASFNATGNAPNEVRAVIHGDNKFGRFTLYGTVVDFDISSIVTKPVKMNLSKIYHEFWNKTNRRPARKRVASSAMTPEELEKAKRIKTAKAYKNLTGSSNGGGVVAPGRASGRRTRKPKKLDEQPLRTEPPSHLPKWAHVCWDLLDDVLEYDEKINKSKPLRGIFFRPVADDPTAHVNDFYTATYVPALTQLHTYPMDLGTVRKDLIDGKFENHHSFACEVRRVFHNAIAFWMDRQSMPKTYPIVVAATVLARKFEERYKPVVTREAQEIARKARNAEMKRKADEAKRLKRAADKAKREAERQKKRERKEREKLMKRRQREKEREAKRRKKEEDMRRKAKERERDRASRGGGRSGRSGSRRPGRGTTERERRLERQLNRMQEMLERAAGGGFGGGGFGAGYGLPGAGGNAYPAPNFQGQQARQTSGSKKKSKPRVSEAAKRKCVKGLPKVAHRFVHEFKKLCKELKLLDRDGSVQLNLHTMPDDECRKICDFVKRKLRIIQKEKEQKSNEAASKDLREAAENEARANRVENERMRNRLVSLDNQQASVPNPPIPPSAGAAGVVFDSDDEPDANIGAFDPFAPMTQSSSGSTNSATAGFRPPRGGSWDAAKEMKDADDRRRQAATNANAHLQNANRQGYEKDAQDVREEVRKKENEQRRYEAQMRENQAAKDRERDEHRRQQQSAREALAMRDSFENPDADEEYDPYSFGFGDE